MADLFRKEALRAQGNRLLGDVVIAQPISLRRMVLFLVSVVLVILLLISQASYARKEVVTGYIAPDRGVVGVGAARAGVVTQIHFKEGEIVDEGAPLITIESMSVTSSGIAVNAEMLRSVELQLQEIEQLGRIITAQFEERENQLRLKIEGLRSSRDALENRLENQGDLVRLLESNLTRLRALASKGYISALDMAAKEQEVLSARQVLTSLSQQLDANENEVRRTVALAQSLPLDLQERLSEQNSQRANIQLQKLQLSEQGSVTVVSPAAGKVTASVVVEGQTVVSQQPLLSLVPADSDFEAHLYVPSKAIGFITEGQEVRILYDSFDYREFGVQTGTITEVSSAVLSASESLRKVQRNEPTYKVRVKLSHQFFRSHRGQFDLSSGMTLRADIVLEKRSIASWVLNPVLTLKGRT